MARWLLIDVSYLCYRAFYTTGDLSHKEVKTGVIYGFLRDIELLKDLHGTDRVVFCFDYGESYRTNIYKGYKANRKKKQNELDEKGKRALEELRTQIRSLRDVYLKDLGYKNILFKDGIEGDDFIAEVALNTDKENEYIIISADKDLYQILRNNVSMYNPRSKELLTKKKFIKQYGIKPKQWMVVKSITGCLTDNIPGIDGVGEVTACKYLRGELKETSKLYQKIKNNKELINFNKKIVELPHLSTPRVVLKKDKVDPDQWKSLVRKLGIKSLDKKERKLLKKKGFEY